MKKIGSIAAAGALLILLFTALRDNGGNPAERKPEYRTVEMARGDLTVRIAATGVVEPNFQVEVKSKASGDILRFPFAEGDFVKKGTLLLELNKSNEKRNVAKAQANLKSAQAQLKKAETALALQQTKYGTDLQQAQAALGSAEASLQETASKLRRQTELFAQQFTSQEMLDTAKTAHKVQQEALARERARLEAAVDAKNDLAVKEQEIELARSEVTRSQIALDEAKERLDETEIYAPIDGVIIKKMVEVGQIISSGMSTVTGGTAICLIADMSRLFITADVDETDIGAIQLNQEVGVTTDAFPAEQFTGVVKRIAPQGEVENNITIFKVKIEIVGANKELLRPKMTANVNILTHESKDVLYAPREAIYKEKNRTYAVVLENNQPRQVDVTTGIKNELNAQILTGLDLGQKLVVGDWKKVQAEQEKSAEKSSSVRKMLWLLRSK